MGLDSLTQLLILQLVAQRLLGDHAQQAGQPALRRLDQAHGQAAIHCDQADEALAFILDGGLQTP